jgi:hypothetical protein
MNQDQASNQSPFSALSYQEQQDRWLEWRSRQLDYRPAAVGQAQETSAPKDRGVPQMRLPNMRIASPVRHRELDEVLTRHRQAMQRAGAFQATPID